MRKKNCFKNPPSPSWVLWGTNLPKNDSSVIQTHNSSHSGAVSFTTRLLTYYARPLRVLYTVLTQANT